MNLVVINIDTLRTDWLGLYGNDWVKTPHLDAFAADALVFDEAYLSSFPTIPCRTDLFTGRSGEPFHPWQALNYLEPTLPEELGQAGWATQMIFDCPHLMQGGTGFDRPFGAWDFIRGAEVDKWRLHDRGVRIPTFDQDLVGDRLMRQQHAQYARNWGDHVSEETMHTARLADSVCRWLEENQRHPNSLLWVESFAPHEPWLPPEHYYEPYLNGPDLDVPMAHATDVAALGPEMVRVLRARYAGYITFVDHQVGRIFDKLRRLGRLDDTAVVVMSDHGSFVGDHGKICTKSPPLYDGIARILTMVRLPGGPRNGQHTKAIIQPPDLMPTLLDIAGLPIPDHCQGKSYLGVLRGETDTHRDYAVSGTANGHDTPRLTMSIRQGGWVLHEVPNDGRRELYHVAGDPEESQNLIDSEPAKAAALRALGVEYLREHGAAPQFERLLLTGDPGDLSDYRLCLHPVPGYFSYWRNTYVTPEDWITP